MSSRVILILDLNYGDKLKNLCINLPIWVVDSPENEDAINKLRANNTCSISVTSFPLKDNESLPHACGRILESLDQHHNEYSVNGEYSELEVIGVTVEAMSMELFYDYGFTKFSKTDGGFIAYKTCKL